MGKAVMLSLVVALSGCGSWERFTAKVSGYSTICVDGVSYIQFTSGATVQYNSDGSVRKCR